MKKRLLLLTLALLLSVVGWAATEIDGIYYNLYESSKTAEVTSGSNSYSGNVVIPTSVTTGGTTYSVTSIGSDAFRWCSNLTTIILSSSITSIGNRAFYDCSGLTSITMQGRVTSIGNSAFYNCSSLNTISIPNSVTSIGDYTFYQCSSLTTISIPNSVISIGNSAFSNCSSLTRISIPNSVTTIGNYSFYNCSGLTSITIPNSVTSIGYSAFDGCSNLTSITIPNSVTSIGNSAFSGCSSLTRISIPNSVTSIGNYSFRGCSGLTSITIPNSVTSIGISAFYGCSSLTRISIPNSVTSIGNYSFYGCSGLTSITIPNSVTSIGNSAFAGCSSLTTISIPNSVTTIGDYSFQSCSSLTTISIPSSITSIGNSVFSACRSLSSIRVAGDNGKYDSRNDCNAIIETSSNTLIAGCSTSVIPNGVTSIANSAFSGISNLSTVTIPSSVTTIGDNVFYGCSNLTSIQVANGNNKYDSRNDCNAIIETSSNTLIAGCKTSIIPNSILSIGKSAFYGCSDLTTIIIPNCVTNIGSSAFRGCRGLTTITLPNSVTTIDSYAFSNCNSLNSITIPSSVTSIGNWAFSDCSSLTSLTIPSSMTNIGDATIYGCDAMTDIFCLAEELPNAVLSAFDKVIGNIILHVPASVLETYKSTEPWSNFKAIVPIDDEEDDLQRYLNSLIDTEDELTDNVYRREFKNGDWQSLYIPFEMDYNDWSGEFEVAELWRLFWNGYQNVIEATMNGSGSLWPNTPYLIRAKSEQGATLTANVKGSITKKEGRTPLYGDIGQIGIWGNYSKRTGMNSNNEYRMQGGSLSVPYSDAEVLMPYRWYASARPDNSSRIAIEIIVDGSTAIKSVTSSEEKAAVYDLSGRRMESDVKSLPKGVYIIDNKKRVIR